MERYNKANSSGCNLQVGKFMHQENDGICIGDNVKISQHGPGFENIYQGDGGEHLESPCLPPLVTDVADTTSCICYNGNLIEVHARYQPCSSFDPYDRNCPNQCRISNCCD